MARKSKKGGESLSSYFRKLFTEHPDWVEQKSNAVVLDQYRIDNGLAPEADVGKSVKEAMANMKSICRKALRGGETVASVGKKRGRKPGRRVAAVTSDNASLAPVRSKGSLEQLEIMIDDCLTMARQLNLDGLAGVVRALRYARNKVVYLGGEPSN